MVRHGIVWVWVSTCTFAREWHHQDRQVGYVHPNRKLSTALPHFQLYLSITALLQIKERPSPPPLKPSTRKPFTSSHPAAQSQSNDQASSPTKNT
jgi:hypothetical protein